MIKMSALTLIEEHRKLFSAYQCQKASSVLRFKARRKTGREGLLRERQWGRIFSTIQIVIMNSKAWYP